MNRHTREIHGFHQLTIEEVLENKQHLLKIESGELGIQKFDPLVARKKLTTVVVNMSFLLDLWSMRHLEILLIIATHW